MAVPRHCCDGRRNEQHQGRGRIEIASERELLTIRRDRCVSHEVGASNEDSPIRSELPERPQRTRARYDWSEITRGNVGVSIDKEWICRSLGLEHRSDGSCAEATGREGDNARADRELSALRRVAVEKDDIALANCACEENVGGAVQELATLSKVEVCDDDFALTAVECCSAREPLWDLEDTRTCRRREVEADALTTRG